MQKKDSVNTRTNGTCALCSDSNTNLEASALNPVAQPNPVLLVRPQLNIPVLALLAGCMQVNLGRPYEYDEGPPAAIGLFHRALPSNQPTPQPPLQRTPDFHANPRGQFLTCRL